MKTVWKLVMVLLTTLFATYILQLAPRSLPKKNGVSSSKGTMLLVASRDKIGEKTPRSPDLTQCQFYLWGYVKDQVYQPPVPKSFRKRISQVTANVDESQLRRTEKNLNIALTSAE
jgi:hypothetical protein